ncbi:MAG: YybS family protein [Treponema sp.]|nr:YybS family protein [Treponema sp.]
MYPEEAGYPAGQGMPDNTEQKTGTAFLPALICAVLSTAMMRIGFLSFLFLVPLGYAAVIYNAAVAWYAFAFSLVLNGFISIVVYFFSQTEGAGFFIDNLYFAAITLGFTWIMAGSKGTRIVNIRTAYRFIIASVTGALVFLLIVLGSRNNSGFAAFIKAQADFLSSAIISSSTVDAARRSFLEEWLTPERVLEIIGGITLRGGAVVSMFLLFFVNRRISLTAAWILKKRKSSPEIITFRAPGNTIWFMSCSLAVILLARTFRMTVPEIAAWNVLVISAILFLTQGAGIIIFILARMTVSPVVRLIINVLIFVVIFSPGINTVALAAVVLLGIAENWVPFRAPKNNGPTSTPGF